MKPQDLFDFLGSASPSLTYKWSSGFCADFSIALSKFLIDHCACNAEQIQIQIGTRFSYNSNLDNYDEVFSHAVLQLTINNEIYFVDCDGIDAIKRWEQKFAEYEQSIESEFQKSSFEWVSFTPDPDIISHAIHSIDESLPVDQENIDDATEFLISLANPTLKRRMRKL